jgi:predicted DNA-binding transcriptional regulator AlpA
MTRLLTAREVAATLGMSTAWVLSHAKGTRRPLIPSIRLGRAVRFRSEDVTKFIEQQLANAGKAA